MMQSVSIGAPTTGEHLNFLASLVKEGRTLVVEFGTFIGGTTRCLAEAGATVHTIDIGRGINEKCFARTEKGLVEIFGLYGEYEVGNNFQGLDLPIIQYLGDSREIDLSHLYGTVGLVFIDGGHSYEVVSHDSAEAFKLIRPDGVIVWDDYNENWPGVVRAVNEVSVSCDILFHKKLCMAVYGWLPHG
jgi:predicted O-methyltransferase YrrM